jgi:hypothetical protein
MSMNLRHAAALALVGWYLMMPPPDFDHATHLPNGRPNTDAPFSYWRNDGSFDSAKECKAELQNNIEFSKQIESKIRREHRSEQQESALEDKMDQQSNSPKGFSRGLRGYGLIGAMSAQCVASDDPRLKEK